MQRLCKGFEVWPFGDVSDIAVVHAGTSDTFFIYPETKWFNQMQFASVVCTQPDNVTCVGWNLWIDEYDIEHNTFVSVLN